MIQGARCPRDALRRWVMCKDFALFCGVAILDSLTASELIEKTRKMELKQILITNVRTFIFTVTLVCFSMADTDRTIYLGHMSGETSGAHPPMTAVAVKLALERFIEEGHMPDYNFTIVYTSPGCDPAQGVAAVMNMYRDDHVDVILGPYCGDVCVAMGYVMRYFNLLHLPSSCTNAELNDKTIFNTLVRTSAGMHKMGSAMAEILPMYGWKRIFLWHRDCCSCMYGAIDMEKTLPRHGITIAERVREPLQYSESIPLAWILEGLKRIRQRARVVVMCFYYDDLWRIMKAAKDAGMIAPEYTWLFYVNNPTDVSDVPWIKLENTVDQAELDYIKTAFYSMKEIHFLEMDRQGRNDFFQKMKERVTRSPWNISGEVEFPSTSLNLHDAAYLYLMLVNQTISDGGDYRDGRLLAQKARGVSFQGMSGHVLIGDDGDREPSYVLKHYYPGSQVFTEYARLKMYKPIGQRYTQTKAPYWPTEGGMPPPDTPACGFNGKLCHPDNSERDSLIISFLCIVVVAILGIGVLHYAYRKWKKEQDLQLMLWKIPYEELQFKENIGAGMRSSRSLGGSLGSTGFQGQTTNMRGFGHHTTPRVAMYKRQLVIVKNYSNSQIVLTRDDLLQLQWLKDLAHINLNPFLGACITPPNICVIHSFCAKGSLQDILENDDIKLDWMFKNSLISDLVDGMCYIHHSPFSSHGNLKSSNCLIDGRWVLKVSDCGLGVFRKLRSQRPDEEALSYEISRESLWSAPELLRMEKPPVYGSKEGDVYSFAIILQEVVFRALPFFYGIQTPQEIIKRVEVAEQPPFRPDIRAHGENTRLDILMLDVMEICWAEHPEKRPTFADLRRRLKKYNQGNKTDIVDLMLNKLEKYACNLEELVSTRTSQLVEEKKKTDLLLFRMLPRSVAEQLKQGDFVQPELYDKVTIYFSDIVGFTTMCSDSLPMEVVDLLNDLYTMFDDIIHKHDVYKVETIGDAYMVVSGLPKKTIHHAANVADMALNLLSEVTHFRIRHRPDQQLLLRAGIHSGSCAAGIVGHAMPRYCLFGDTVNVASRMESTGQALKIHTSFQTYNELLVYQRYEIIERGTIEVKGKGSIPTYWLVGRQGPKNHTTYQLNH